MASLEGVGQRTAGVAVGVVEVAVAVEAAAVVGTVVQMD